MTKHQDNKPVQLIYLSRPTFELSVKSFQAEIRESMTEARKNNPTMQITGTLMFSSNVFLQVLEGPKARV